MPTRKNNIKRPKSTMVVLVDVRILYRFSRIFENIILGAIVPLYERPIDVTE